MVGRKVETAERHPLPRRETRRLSLPRRLPSRIREIRFHRTHPSLPRLRHAHEGTATAARVHRSPAPAGERARTPQTAAGAHLPRDESRMGVVDTLILVSSNPNKGIEAERILGIPLLRVSL